MIYGRFTELTTEACGECKNYEIMFELVSVLLNNISAYHLQLNSVNGSRRDGVLSALDEFRKNASVHLFRTTDSGRGWSLTRT